MKAAVLFAFGCCAFTLGARAAELPSIEHLSDGTELIVAELPAAKNVSFRYLVHTGAIDDPPRSEGMAHFVEHLVVQGDYRVDEQQLFRLARMHGASLNAFTGPEHTVYVVDAPSAAAEVIIPSYLGAITNPVFAQRAIDLQRGVISAEAVLRDSNDIYWLMSQLLLPGFRARGGIIGTERSRSEIDRDDVLSFYATNYVPANVSIVFTGNITAARARELVESNSRLAPSNAAAPARAEVMLSTPVEAKVPAPLYATLFGYDVGGLELATCRGLAELLEVRLRTKITVARATVAEVNVSCLGLRGRLLLLAIASTRSYQGGELTDLLQQAFREGRTRAMSAAERSHLQARSRHRVERLARAPELMADALVHELTGGGKQGDHLAAFRLIFEPVLPEADLMRRAAERFFQEERRVLISVAPF